MYHIEIIALGSIKESYLRDALDEYLKRLSPYAKISIKEIREEKFSQNHSKEKILKLEVDKIKKAIDPKSIVIALDENYSQKTSSEFANFIKENGQIGTKLTFVIGGPQGLHKTILHESDFQISLSKMTFTHQMIRIFLVEQIYRAMTILQGKHYHY